MANEKIIKGGFLAGKKTYVAGGLSILGALAAYLTGEANLIEAMQVAVPAVVGMTVRNGIANSGN